MLAEQDLGGAGHRVGGAGGAQPALGGGQFLAGAGVGDVLAGAVPGGQYSKRRARPVCSGSSRRQKAQSATGPRRALPVSSRLSSRPGPGRSPGPADIRPSAPPGRRSAAPPGRSSCSRGPRGRSGCEAQTQCHNCAEIITVIDSEGRDSVVGIASAVPLGGIGSGLVVGTVSLVARHA
jgi:hypothetical protein